jgi:hypothetical protein
MLKRVLRRIARSTKGWLDEHPDEEPLFHSSLYSWANDNYTKILREKGCNNAIAWGVLQGAGLAKTIGVNQVSVIEFGVAGGNGLVALENIAAKVEGLLGIEISVYGFDTGTGLPAIADYRDKPHLHQKNDFPMDEEKLRSRLARAQLVIGNVKDTISSFVHSRPNPVSFIAFDLDLYSSTMYALRLLEADEAVLMPRVLCFFDDFFACGDFDGERLAVSEFNASHRMRKISPIHGLRYFVPARQSKRVFWGKYHIAHIFDHSLYTRNQGLLRRTIDLSEKES